MLLAVVGGVSAREPGRCRAMMRRVEMASARDGPDSIQWGGVGGAAETTASSQQVHMEIRGRPRPCAAVRLRPSASLIHE